MTSPYRCETCKNEDCEYHPMWIEDMSDFQKQYRSQLSHFISAKGCASHSDFQNSDGLEQWLNTEISQREKIADEYGDGFSTSANTLRMVLKKIKELRGEG